MDMPPTLSIEVPLSVLILDDFRRIRIVFNNDIDTIIEKEEAIVR